LYDAIAISASTAAVKVASAVKVIVSGQFFGAGDSLDAYLIAFLIPSFLGDVFAGALNPALIPAVIEARERTSSESATAIYAAALYRSLAIFSLAALVLLACSHPVLKLVASGFSPAKLALSGTLLAYMVAILPLIALSVIWRSILNANDHFAVAAIAPVMTPLVTIAALAIGAPYAGVEALAAGTTLGALCEVAVLFLALHRLSIPAFPRWSWKSSRPSGVFDQYYPVALSNAVMGGSTMVDHAMAAMLGAGSISLLSFGTRVSGVLLAVGPVALSTALFPRFSAMSARGEWRRLRRLLGGYLLLAAGLTVPAALALAWFSQPIARIAFQRGAFTAGDTRVVAIVQAFSFLQLPLAVMLALLIRAIASLRANTVLIKISAVALPVNAGLNYALMRWLGVPGIALSTTLVHSLLVVVVGAIVFRRLRSRVQTEGKDISDVRIGRG
jgi:putative peptidoglycan lipid II flippase